jgi:hypothetical protein
VLSPPRCTCAHNELIQGRPDKHYGRINVRQPHTHTSTIGTLVSCHSCLSVRFGLLLPKPFGSHSQHQAHVAPRGHQSQREGPRRPTA